MIELRGKYNTAKVFTDNIDSTTISQVMELCNQEFVEGEQIRIMPDCHAGAGCVIGTTMTLKNKRVVPNLVGVDIGCGMLTVKLEKTAFYDLKELDKVIRERVPSGFDTHANGKAHDNQFQYDRIFANFDLARAKNSVGTLGGGNHFIEVDVDREGNHYLVIHSGSRNLGKTVAEFWQNIAEESHPELKGLAYLDGSDFYGYINDMEYVQKWAHQNRITMATEILAGMRWHAVDSFSTIHNYIDTETLILRKGAVSAGRGEKLLIPINMRDGSIVATGRGESDWNVSAPHGAGRILSRGQAKRTVSLEEYQESMRGIYTTSVNASTLDESPMAYKNMDEIVENIKDSVNIVDIIKPVYNFKNSSGD